MRAGSRNKGMAIEFGAPVRLPVHRRHRPGSPVQRPHDPARHRKPSPPPARPPSTASTTLTHWAQRRRHVTAPARLAARSTRSYGISCVPYARQVSGIEVVGNAWQWWDNAAGLYARGDRPEAGSVLNFRANGRMRLGHVAVVTRVVNAREVIVDHANWPSGGGRGGGYRTMSPWWTSPRPTTGRRCASNWAAAARSGRSTRPMASSITAPTPAWSMASVARPAPQPAINPVPSDLRPAAERPWRTMEEVAEAPAKPRQPDRPEPARQHRCRTEPVVRVCASADADACP